MEKLDVKDRKILHQLDVDSRQSFSSIGKKVGLHKDVVAYRIKRLQEKGIIKNFCAVIDASKLGYISFRFYFVFQYASPEIKKEITDYFINNKHTYFISIIEGIYDRAVIMWVKDVNDFYAFYEETLRKYGDYFKEQYFSAYIRLFNYKFSFLQDEKDDRIKPELTGGSERVEYDDLDFQILKLIAPDTRMPTIEIAKKLNSTALTINNRIKNLIKLGVIKAFRVNIDFLKIGYQQFKVDIKLKEYKQRKQIINYIEHNPRFYPIHLNETVGHADLEIEFCVESISQLHQIMEDIAIKFPDAIKHYKHYNILDMIKRQFMPEK